MTKTIETARDAVREYSRAFADADYYEFHARCLWYLSGFAPQIGLREASEIVNDIRDEYFAKGVTYHE
jgi:hypothetical protein